MHLVIPIHLSLFWVIYHPSRTSPLKELKRESQNRLPPSPHCQIIPSLTSYPWPTAPVLARYKWVVFEPYACSTPMWIYGLSVVYAFAIACGFVWSCYAFCCLFLTLCGVDESLGLHSLHLVSPLAGFCFGMGLFFFDLASVSFYFWFVDQLVFLSRNCIASTMVSLNLCLLGLL